MSGKKILIIDDDKDLLLGLAVRLKGHGYAVAAAQDSTTGLSLARKEQPDLIILDLGLPGGNGFLLIEWIRNLVSTATIPIIVLSARDPAGNREWALKNGALAYLQKPAQNEELLGAIRQALGEAEPTRAANDERQNAQHR